MLTESVFVLAILVHFVSALGVRSTLTRSVHELHYITDRQTDRKAHAHVRDRKRERERERERERDGN